MNSKTKTTKPKAAQTEAAPAAAQTEAVAQTEAAAPTTLRAKRTMLSAAIKYEVMTAVREKYADSGLTDSEFASALSEQFSSNVSVSVIKSAREAFGIAQTKPASAAELKARIAELEAALAAKGEDQPV